MKAPILVVHKLTEGKDTKMKMFLFCALLTVGTAACGDEGGYTWGDAADELSTAYCQAIADCGFLPADNVGPCTRHNVSHLCELFQTCDTEVDESVEALVSGCVVSLADPGTCTSLGWGLLPPPCTDAINSGPEEE